jgi:hypothetical protein
MKLGNTILRRLALRPWRTVVVDDQRAWPAWQLWWTACHVASAIERSTTADRVGIMVPTSGLFPAATLGAWMAGRTCVPLNYLFTPQDMEHVCGDASIECCVTIDPMLQFTKGLPTGVRALRMELRAVERLLMPPLLRCRALRLLCRLEDAPPEDEGGLVLISRGATRTGRWSRSTGVHDSSSTGLAAGPGPQSGLRRRVPAETGGSVGENCGS